MARDEQKSRALIQNSIDSSPQEELPKHLTLHPFPYKGLVKQRVWAIWYFYFAKVKLLKV